MGFAKFRGWVEFDERLVLIRVVGLKLEFLGGGCNVMEICEGGLLVVDRIEKGG